MNTRPTTLRRPWTLVTMLTVVLAVGLLTACESLDEEQTTIEVAPTTSTANVRIYDYGFKPQSLDVKKGTSVVWKNDDPVDHTVTADNGSFDRLLKAGDNFTYTFNSVGTFKYTDRLNTQSTLNGEIVVTE